MRFQIIPPSRPARIRFGVTMSMRMIPFWIALATSSPEVNAAVKLKNAAQMTAADGLSTRVPTIVAIEFAESWKPLMKSKKKAIATIATTDETTASGVLDGDAVHRVRDAHALIDRDLERLVDLLPADHLERVGRAGEELSHGLV